MEKLYSYVAILYKQYGEYRLSFIRFSGGASLTKKDFGGGWFWKIVSKLRSMCLIFTILAVPNVAILIL